MIDIFCGDWTYHTLEESETKEYLDLSEKRYLVDVSYRFWHKKWDRFYMKVFNNKGKTFTIKSDIKYPSRKWTTEDFEHGISADELEYNMSYEIKHFLLTTNQNVSDAVNKYKDIVLKKRSVESEHWVPSEYKIIYQREIKLKRILDDDNS